MGGIDDSYKVLDYSLDTCFIRFSDIEDTMNLEFYKDKRVGILGLGLSGLAAARALLSGGAKIVAWDDDEGTRFRAQRAGIPISPLINQASFKMLDYLILSPGIPHHHPYKHRAVALAEASECEIICDIELVCSSLKGSNFIGVTGTDGKSTVTSLIGHILSFAGVISQVGGNIGVPVCELDDLGKDSYYVLELSSFHLELMHKSVFNYGVLVNISSDHLDRYFSHRDYVKAKASLFDLLRADSLAVISVDDEYSRNIFANFRGSNKVAISGTQPVAGGIYVEQGCLIDDRQNQRREVLSLDGVYKEFSFFPNSQNLSAAYGVVSDFDIEDGVIFSALSSFSFLSHRQEKIGNYASIDFINDSKATNCSSARAALMRYENIFWIAGGMAKKEGFSELLDYLQNIREGFFIGSASKHMQDFFSPFIPCRLAENLEQALSQAFSCARYYHKGAGADKALTILLSPACASYDMWSNFAERGQEFKDLVNNLLQKVVK